MIVLVGRLAHSEILSQSCCKCVASAWNRFVSTSGIKEDVPLAKSCHQPESIPYEEVVQERQIEIHTCGKLFEKWRQEKRYWSVSKSGLTFNVKYIDTGHYEDKSSMPTVLSLHGSPGSHKEFDAITSQLYKKGVRVIAPNFPRSVDVHPSKFRHTPEEKSEFIRDFLRALRVSSVDLILCHSSALFPGLQLSLNSQDIAVNSLALINPTGLDIPRLLKPVWLFNPLIRMSEFPFGYKLTEMVGTRLAQKPELKGGSFEEHYLSAFTLLHSSIPEHVVPFQTLLNQNFPVLLAFSHNDKLISKKTSYKMADMMVDMNEVVIYDKDGNAHGSGGVNPFRKVLAFEKGSHFLTRTYPNVISEAVSSFLFQQFDNTVKLKRSQA